jgi:hypothetical protein
VVSRSRRSLFPGHFLVRAPNGALIDPCTGATPLPEDALAEMAVRELGLDRATIERMLLPADARTVAIRMLENLEHAYAGRGDRASARRIGERLSVLRGPEAQTQRLVASLIRGLLPQKSPRRSLSVQREGRFFRIDDGPAIDLSRRRALPLLLLRLASHHARSSQGMGWPALVEAGWPGEKIGADAAWARLRTAIRTLRALGLEGVLITIGTGYLIDPSFDVRWVD